jgi:hypothetical protein
MNQLHRRLTSLEQTPSARRLVLRVFASAAEAAADSELPAAGTTLAVITGVPRSGESAT